MKQSFIITLFILLLAACGGQEATATPVAAYNIVRPAELEPGDTVPVPVSDVILTLTGQINQTNVADTLQFDMESLEKVGLVEYTVEDKQAEGGTVMFQGVLLSDLLAVAGMSQTAITLNMTALNDYSVAIPVNDALDYPLLLATAVNGERMTVARYGPTRIIYPYHAYDLDETIYDPRWIWQLATIDVR